MRHRASSRHTHLQLDQANLTRAKSVLGAKAETESSNAPVRSWYKEHTLDQPLKRTKGGMQLQGAFR